LKKVSEHLRLNRQRHERWSVEFINGRAARERTLQRKRGDRLLNRRRHVSLLGEITADGNGSYAPRAFRVSSQLLAISGLDAVARNEGWPFGTDV